MQEVVSKKKAHPWEEPLPPSRPKGGWSFKAGLSAPDVTSNPSLWPFRWIYGGRALRRVKELARSSRRILDVRCGTGWLLWELAKVAPQAQLLGLDTRVGALAWGQLQSELRLGATMGKVELKEQSFLDLEAADGTYDLILCNFALSQTDDAAPWLEKMERLLKPGGYIYYYEATEPTSHTVDQLARYYLKRRRWRGMISDLWNLRREVRSMYAKDSLRSLRHPAAAPEVELYAAFQGLFEVMEQGRFRSLTDLWLRALPTRFRWFWLGLLLAVDRLAIAMGWADGARRYALGRKLP